MSLEEQIIFEKLTGKCQIHPKLQESPSIREIKSEKQFDLYRMEVYKMDSRQVEQSFADLGRYLCDMETNRTNIAFRNMHSSKAVVGKIIVFVKRVIRKCLKWCIEPICNQQTEFNNATTSAIRSMSQLQQSTMKEVHDMLQQLSEAKEQLQVLRECGAFLEDAVNEQVVKKSTAQSGEDMISEYITRVLGKRIEELSYLDLGANHAKLYSNTYHFYQKGVRGVLVEANPALIGELKLFRSGDIILNRCIASTSGKTVNFYVLNGDGLSTPDKAGAETAIAENPDLKIEQIVPVRTVTVEEILDTYFDNAPTIINLDIEGEEMNILNSIDFKKHRPLIMIIETIPYRKHLVVGLKNQEIVDFMDEKGYVEYAFTGINSIFIDKEQISEVLE